MSIICNRKTRFRLGFGYFSSSLKSSRTQIPSSFLLCCPQHVTFCLLVNFSRWQNGCSSSEHPIFRVMPKGQKSKHSFLASFFLIHKEKLPRSLQQTPLISCFQELHHTPFPKLIPGKKNKTTIPFLNQSHFTQGWVYLPWDSWTVNIWTQSGFYWTRKKGAAEQSTNITCLK